MGSNLTDQEIKSQVDELFQIEKSFAQVEKILFEVKIFLIPFSFQLTLSEDQRRNNTFKNMTLQELANDIPQVQILLFFSKLEFTYYIFIVFKSLNGKNI